MRPFDDTADGNGTYPVYRYPVDLGVGESGRV